MCTNQERKIPRHAKHGGGRIVWVPKLPQLVGAGHLRGHRHLGVLRDMHVLFAVGARTLIPSALGRDFDALPAISLRTIETNGFTSRHDRLLSKSP